MGGHVMYVYTRGDRLAMYRGWKSASLGGGDIRNGRYLYLYAIAHSSAQ